MKSLCSFLLCFFIFGGVSSAQNAVEIIKKMSVAINNIQNSSFILHTKERFGEKYVYKIMKFHIQESPRKVYLKDMKSGVELLYVSGWNKNKAYINPNGFPWVNISLNRFDYQVVHDSHHTVDDAGLSFVNKLLKGFEKSVSKYGKSTSSLYMYKGEVTYNNRECYKLYIIPPMEFKYLKYTTTKDQKLLQLSRDLVASDYLIKEKNKLNYIKTIKKGTTISVPSSFAKKVVVYIDKKTYLPVVQMLFDEKGLFEKFEYKKLSVKPNFISTEFTTDCSTYGF